MFNSLRTALAFAFAISVSQPSSAQENQPQAEQQSVQRFIKIVKGIKAEMDLETQEYVATGEEKDFALFSDDTGEAMIMDCQTMSKARADFIRQMDLPEATAYVSLIKEQIGELEVGSKNLHCQIQQTAPTIL